MRVKIDKLGRAALPKPREALLRPANQKASMVKIQGWWVHQGVAESGLDRFRVVEQAREDRDLSNMGLGRFSPTQP